MVTQQIKAHSSELTEELEFQTGAQQQISDLLAKLEFLVNPVCNLRVYH